MRHGILGPGGVGGLIGAVLADAGEDVTLIVRAGTETLYAPELSLTSPFRNITPPVSIVAKLTKPIDVLWITVKAPQLSAALNDVPRQSQIKAVVPLLNGIDHVELLRMRFGREFVVPATIAVESERVGPGKIVQRSSFVRLNVLSSGRESLVGATEILQKFGFECAFVDDETTLLWGKLVFLAPLALSTAANRSPIGEVLADPGKAARLAACVAEVCEVAVRCGAKVGAIAILAGIKALPPGMRSSMEKDLANGKAPELDSIAGPILRAAERYDVPAEATLQLYRDVIRQSNLHQ